MLLRGREDWAYGYDAWGWGNMTALLDEAMDNQITVAWDLEDREQLLSHDALWIDLRAHDDMSSSEVSNIRDFIATGRRVVMMGEYWGNTDWCDQLFAIVWATYDSYDSGNGDATRVLSHELTASAETVHIYLSGLASGGTSLYDQPFATLWGASQNVLIVLDVVLFLDVYWDSSDNAQFAANVANWIAGGP